MLYMDLKQAFMEKFVFRIYIEIHLNWWIVYGSLSYKLSKDVSFFPVKCFLSKLWIAQCLRWCENFIDSPLLYFSSIFFLFSSHCSFLSCTFSFCFMLNTSPFTGLLLINYIAHRLSICRSKLCWCALLCSYWWRPLLSK